MIRRNNFIFLFLVLFIGLSCEKFSGEQSIPAYLTIDSVYLSTDYQSQGTTSQRITDIWVNIDNEFLGAYELPAKFPVLMTGKHKVKLWPGIKKNGISATRASYDFYVPVEKEIMFTPDSTTRMGTLKTSYQTSTLFYWREDFEDVAISLDTTSRSTAYFTLTNSPDSTFEGVHSGKVVLDSLRDFFECQTRNEYPIPSAPVYLELNFNISNSLTVGIFSYGTAILYQTPIITLNPTNGQWRKIYIDLTTSLNAYLGMRTFRVYMGTFKNSGLDKSVILLDNFKLLTRKPS